MCESAERYRTHGLRKLLTAKLNSDSLRAPRNFTGWSSGPAISHSLSASLMKINHAMRACVIFLKENLNAAKRCQSATDTRFRSFRRPALLRQTSSVADLARRRVGRDDRRRLRSRLQLHRDD